MWPLALVVAGAALISYSGARITEALTDDPDKPALTPALTAVAFGAAAVALLWWISER